MVVSAPRVKGAYLVINWQAAIHTYFGDVSTNEGWYPGWNLIQFPIIGRESVV